MLDLSNHLGCVCVGRKCLWASFAGCVFLMMWYGVLVTCTRPEVCGRQSPFDQGLHFLKHVCLGYMIPSRFYVL